MNKKPETYLRTNWEFFTVFHRDREVAEKRKDYEKKLETLAKLKPEEIIELEKKIWTKSELLPLYYSRQKS